MSKRFDAARCGAFLEALGVTGNVTLSAERCNVSRSWVALRRAEDAGFDEACRRICRQARERLRGGANEDATGPPPPSADIPSADRRRSLEVCSAPPAGGRGIRGAPPAGGRGSNAPPSDWAYLAGAELVVRGSNGRRCQIGRARAGQWSARTEERFLAALSATCNVKAACAEVGRHQTSAYAHRKRWTAFARRWDEAIETGYVRIEMALLGNACNLFSNNELPPEEVLRDMTVEQALHVLHMHKCEVRGIGRKPGRMGLPPSLEEVEDSIRRKIDIIIRARGIKS